MTKTLSLTGLLLIALAWAPAAFAAEEPPTESDYYKILTFPIPEDIVLEPGALEILPDRTLAVATRRGDVYFVDNAFSKTPEDVTYHRFAEGFHEALGLDYRDGWLYVTHRPSIMRIKDTDGDRRADLFQTVNGGWDISGDYHEYAFGSDFDRDGNIWVALCLTGSFSSKVPYRGWCVRVTPDGKMVPACSGLRSPGGIGMNAEGEMFMTDNQGPWNGTCSLKHLVPGSFQGHPATLKWYDLPQAAAAMGEKPREPESGSRIHIEAEKIPQYVPPAILFPYQKMGQSASGIACDTAGGKFGPFENQLFVGDVTHSTLMRVFLEEVNGVYQGACFPFREGFASGSLALEMAEDGSLFVGGTSRGWGARGPEPYSLERLVWTGKIPFEVQEMKARPDGFELTFTQPIDPETARDPASYEIETYTYIFQSTYGSPEVDHTQPEITQITVGEDRKSVRLVLDGLRKGHVHELHLDGVRSAAGLPLLHAVAYYTLNEIPRSQQ